jgi:hypothetical protein
MQKPQPVRPKGVKRPTVIFASYPWPLLDSQGWFFVPHKDGYAHQGRAIRSSAKAKGHAVSVVKATAQDGQGGYLVELRK